MEKLNDNYGPGFLTLFWQKNQNYNLILKFNNYLKEIPHKKSMLITMISL
jgi:hypothetical protein